ncbi:SEFIR domain-containing protein [Lentzea sp. NPDC060358]|uniref:SEFIR domain-containing protein n=1 Tax=Lentzea sp. NPDC060358 TaxID=3347103 RepID=UPI003657E70C
MSAVPGHHPKVFIAYAQDSPAHKNAVRSLADLLRSYGVDAEIDQYAEETRQDWNEWAHRLVTESDFVIIVASPRMKAVGDGTAPADQNRGVQAEMTVIRDLLQRDRPKWTKKILPVVLPGGTIDELPDFVGPYALSHYRVEDLTLDGIDTLLRLITSQPRVSRPPLGELPKLPPHPAPAVHETASTEPEWRVLPTPVPVMWRTEIMAVGNQWLPDWSATVELHLAPVTDAARIPSSRLRTLGDRLPSAIRQHGLAPDTEGVQNRLTEDIAQVSHYDPRTGSGASLAVVRNGQRSAWRTLPKATIGNVLIRDDAAADIATMLHLLLELDDALPDQFAPAIGIEPTNSVRIGHRSDLTSNSASMSMSNTKNIRIEAEESLTIGDLTRSATAVAQEMVERLITRFPQH